jgi:hypothetical protein
MKNARSMFVLVLATWLVLTTSAVTVFVWPSPRSRAAIGMGWGLILLLVFLGGVLIHCAM